MTTYSIESLMEDEDMLKNLKREEFLEWIAPVIEKVGSTLKEALSKSGKSLLKLEARLK